MSASSPVVTPPPEPDLIQVVASARAALESGENLDAALRAVLKWVGSAPNPAEQQALVTSGETKFRAEAVTDYLALPVQLMLAPHPGQIVTVNGPDGPFELVQVLFALQCPLANLVSTRILNPDGTVPSPVQGMLPMIGGRWIMPKRKIAPQAQEEIRRSGWTT